MRVRQKLKCHQLKLIRKLERESLSSMLIFPSRHLPIFNLHRTRMKIVQMGSIENCLREYEKQLKKKSNIPEVLTERKKK